MFWTSKNQSPILKKCVVYREISVAPLILNLNNKLEFWILFVQFMTPLSLFCFSHDPCSDEATMVSFVPDMTYKEVFECFQEGSSPLLSFILNYKIAAQINNEITSTLETANEKCPVHSSWEPNGEVLFCGSFILCSNMNSSRFLHGCNFSIKLWKYSFLYYI